MQRQRNARIDNHQLYRPIVKGMLRRSCRCFRPRSHAMPCHAVPNHVKPRKEIQNAISFNDRDRKTPKKEKVKAQTEREESGGELLGKDRVQAGV